MIEIRTMTLADAMSVIPRMRPNDRAGVTAMLGDIEDEAFAVHRWQSNGPAWAVVDDGLVVAVGGIAFHSDWLAVGWFIGSEDMRGQSWRKVVAQTRKVIAKASDPSFVHYRHRIEAHVLDSWPSAQRFAKAFGFEFEGTRRRAGRGGEDMQTWAIVGPVKGSENG